MKAMLSRTAAGACWLSMLLLCSPALVSPSEGAVDLPARWQVQADGWSGTLELSIQPSGSVSGSLQDQTITGFLAGRRLVLGRSIGGRAEVWEGWLPEDPEGEMLFIAGSVTVGHDGSPHPWYAVPEPATGVDDPAVVSPAEDAVEPAAPPVTAVAPAAAAAVPAGEAPPEQEPAAGTATPAVDGESTEEPLASAPDVVRQQPADSTGPDISGAWLATEGPIEILQEGSGLTIVLSDGTRHEGRFTSTGTIVVGLRHGCCNGELESPDRIVLSDGTIWRRAD